MDGLVAQFLSGGIPLMARSFGARFIGELNDTPARPDSVKIKWVCSCIQLLLVMAFWMFLVDCSRSRSRNKRILNM